MCRYLTANESIYDQIKTLYNRTQVSQNSFNKSHNLLNFRKTYSILQINNDRAEALGRKEAEELLKKCETEFELLFIRYLHNFYPLVSEASREVANLTERKNPYTLYMVSKNLSVCQFKTFTIVMGEKRVLGNFTERMR